MRVNYYPPSTTCNRFHLWMLPRMSNFNHLTAFFSFFFADAQTKAVNFLPVQYLLFRYLCLARGLSELYLDYLLPLRTQEHVADDNVSLWSINNNKIKQLPNNYDLNHYMNVRFMFVMLAQYSEEPLLLKGVWVDFPVFFFLMKFCCGYTVTEQENKTMQWLL